MKKILLIICLFLFVNCAFGIRAVTQEEHEHYLKSLGLSEAQIVQLKKIDLKHHQQMTEALNKSVEHRRNNPALSKEEHNKYTSKLLKKVEAEYKKDLGTVLNLLQKEKYLEYQSRIY